KKEDQLWFFWIANFRKILEQFRQHPEQKGRINFRRFLHQLVSSKNVNDAAPTLRLDQIFQIKRRLTEEFVCSLRFQREQVALNRPGAGSRDISILSFKLIGILAILDSKKIGSLDFATRMGSAMTQNYDCQRQRDCLVPNADSGISTNMASRVERRS